MAGVHFEVTGVEQVAAALRRAIAQTQNMHGLHEGIAVLIENSTRRRIAEDKRSPDGAAWPAWSPAYAATRGSGHSLLQGQGDLLDSIQSVATAASAEVGSNLVYAAIHQFGGTTKPHEIRPKRKKALAFGGGFFARVQHPGSEIPARPYLGLDEDDRRDIEELTETWLGGPDGLRDAR
jgi:phage virion morphogenesis protein